MGWGRIPSKGQGKGCRSFWMAFVDSGGRNGSSTSGTSNNGDKAFQEGRPGCLRSLASWVTYVAIPGKRMSTATSKADSRQDFDKCLEP